MLPVVERMLEAARLRHALGFEEIPLPVGELSYEPRSSCQCAQCGAVWVGTKSGVVMHLALAPRTARISQRWFPGTREARSVWHVHDGLTSGGVAVLLVGRDDGSLEIVTDDHAGWSHAPEQVPAEQTWRLHLDTWYANRHLIQARSAGECVESPSDASRRFAAGITAIAVVPRQGPSQEIALLVATRNPWLYVIEADRGALRLAQRIPLPGWIDWIFCPRAPDGPVRLLSRGGQLLSSTAAELRRGAAPHCHELPVLPTAALEVGSPATGGELSDLAVGTATGLVLIRTAPGGKPEVHAVPATRTGVHSMGSAAVRDHDGVHDYVTLGLDDGRLRVFDIDVTRPRRVGTARTAITRSFSIDLGAPVLNVQTLRPAVYPDEQVYMLAALRDHVLRLFRITSEETQRARVRDAWKALLAAHVPGGSTGATARAGIALAASEQLPGSPADAAAWVYAVVDVVLPDLHRAIAGLPAQDRADLRGEIVDTTCALIRRGGPATFDPESRALHRAAATVRDLSGDDVGLALRLSHAVVAAAVATQGVTTSLIKDHVHSLAALCTACQAEDRPKLVAWLRFIRKYILRGATFAAKRLKLTELVEQNYRARKHIDALIYQARLHHRGYDLRWEFDLGEDVAAVHSIAWPPSPPDHDVPEGAPAAIVVVLTVSARLIVLDRTSGKPISFADERGSVARPTLFPEDHGPVRVLTSAVVVDSGVARLIVSCDGSWLAAPGLAVVEIRPHVASSSIGIGPIIYPRCAEPVRVHAIAPLPEHPDTLVLGLNRTAWRVGRLRCRRPWVVECAGYAEDLPGPHHEPRHAPGTLPTRAVAVIAIHDDDRYPRYLAALGSDDGQVLACTFDAGTDAAAWRLERWSLLAEPIASVLLGRHEATGRLSCYLGTSKGEVLAISIDSDTEVHPADHAPRDDNHQRFGPYLARALWRDSHRARVIATRLWHAPMFTDSSAEGRRPPVMVTATANGRLCIYRHDDTTTSQLSARGNHYFRGIRYDRVVLPDAMQTLALTDGSNELIASRPGGVVYLARLMYLRESHFRGEPDGVLSTVPGLPDDSWGRMRRLLSESEIDEPFDVPAIERWQHKLALCELIQLDNGVVANYALRERWRELTPWTSLPADRLVQAIRVELCGLRADSAADVARLTLIFKSVGGAFLSQRLDRLRDELLGHRARSSMQATATAAVCELMCDEILDHLSRTEARRSRLAIVGMKELVRVPVLRAIGGRDASCRTARDAIEEVITACLRHDMRLVRTEALRSISVMLRNLGVMVKGLSPREREQVIAALLPDEIDSVNWLIDPLIHDLKYFPSFKAGNVLVSGAWYRASALAQLFWIFPDRALALCDHMVARGLPVEVLGLCIQVMRGNNVQQARHRIERFFFTDPRKRPIARSEFISAYRCDPLPALPETMVDPNPDDPTAECYLAHLHDLLARMWAVERVEQLPELAERIPQLAVIPRNSRRSYGALVRAVNELAQIARDLSTPGHRVHGQSRLARIADRACEHRKDITSPIQEVVSAIVAHWQAFPLPPEPGMTIRSYELGAYVARRLNHEVFEIAAPADLGNKMITVFRGSSPADREAFVEAARFAHDTPGPGLTRVDELVAVDSLYPAYRTTRPADDLESYLREKPEHAAHWATDLVTELCQALLHIHDHGRSHGDVVPGNVHVAIDALTQHPSITLGGFGNIAGTSHDVERAIPIALLQKFSRTSAWNARRWHDVVSLALLAFRMLVGEAFSLAASSLTEQLQRLKRAMYAAPARDLPLFSAVFEVLEIDRPAVSIHELSARLDPRDARPLRLPKVNVLFAAANPSDTANLTWLNREVTGVRKDLSRQDRWHLQTIDGDGTSGDGSNVRLTVAELLRWLNMGVDVVHFSGHGSRGGIAVWDHDGDGSRIVSGDALGDCFQRHQLTLVVLNSCYSEPQADTILSAISARNGRGAVVGTSHAVGDEAAYLFSVTLYQQLAGGRSIRDAFWAAKNAVGMSGLGDGFVAKGALDLVLAPGR